MSDISIPGVSSRFNTGQMVEELVKAERVPLDRLETRKTDLETQRSTWQSFNRQLTVLRDAARSLFSFENPFNDRSAVSSNESVLTASSDRNTPEGISSIVVNKVAKPDKFISEPVPNDFDVPQGIYEFSVGSTPITLRFRGGNLEEFSAALNQRNPELLGSAVIRNRRDSYVLTLESKLPGTENALGFSGDAQELALDLGLIAPAEEPGFSPDLASLANNESVSFQDGVLSLKPGSNLRIPLPKDAFNPNMMLSYQAVLHPLDESTSVKPPPEGPQITSPGAAEFQGIRLPDLPSTAPLPEYQAPAPPPRQDTQRVFQVNVDGQVVDLPQVPLRTPQNFTLAFSELGIPSELVITNSNTHRNLELSALEISDPTVRGDYQPLNPVSVASDAEIELEGVRIERPTNTMDDVIPGVTLTIKRESPEPVTLSIEPDRERIKDVLIEFVATYNQVIRDINILTRNQPEIVEEISYFTPEEKEEAMERLGSLQGNSTLNTIKNRLQTITMSPYDTRAGNDMRLLAQVGIATNASSQGGAGINASRLRGYLEINESALDQALLQNLPAVKELFGTDSDGDLLVDSGVAFKIDELMRPFVQTGGIITTNTQSIDRQIDRTDEEISSYEDYLAGYEQRMKEQFGRMESAINSLETQSRDIQGLNPQNQN